MNGAWILFGIAAVALLALHLFYRRRAFKSKYQPLKQTKVPVEIFALKLRKNFGILYAKVEEENKRRSGRFTK